MKNELTPETKLEALTTYAMMRSTFNHISPEDRIPEYDQVMEIVNEIIEELQKSDTDYGKITLLANKMQIILPQSSKNN
jgi:hypothetical protein